MSEKQLNRRAKVTVLTPLVILLVGLLLLSSCARQKCIYAKNYKKSNLCPTYR